MITKAINGREYHFRDFLSALDADKFHRIREGVDFATPSGRNTLLAEQCRAVMLHADGTRFASGEDALDAIANEDFSDVYDAVLVYWRPREEGPLASETDSVDA